MTHQVRVFIQSLKIQYHGGQGREGGEGVAHVIYYFMYFMLKNQTNFFLYSHKSILP